MLNLPLPLLPVLESLEERSWKYKKLFFISIFFFSFFFSYFVVVFILKSTLEP